MCIDSAIVYSIEKMSGEVKREILSAGTPPSCLLPLTLNDEGGAGRTDSYCRVRHKRVTPWLLEMVAGMIEEGETIEAVARWEAMEEALTVGRTRPVISYPGESSEEPASAHLFWWVKWTPRPRQVIHGLLDENEDIRSCGKPGTGIPVGRRGENRQRAAVIALQWLQLHHQELKTSGKNEALYQSGLPEMMRLCETTLQLPLAAAQ